MVAASGLEMEEFSEDWLVDLKQAASNNVAHDHQALNEAIVRSTSDIFHRERFSDMP
ncbi:hypothetical protein [Myxococcus sp. Y35]|uniref:hypothetical protein n=1 Tax=Pseudomyxococcus flavus TaxID=3115648 RepID=UPI003CF3A11A